LLLHIKLSPTLYAPSGVAARILTWAKEQQHRVDLSMVSTEETTQDLPDIKVEGYEFLFTEHLHALSLDVATQDVGRKDEQTRPKDELDQTSREGQAVAASFRVLLALLRYGTETTKNSVLKQMRDTQMLRSLICLADDVTNGQWYPANVGPNLLLIMQDLCRLPNTTMEEEPCMVILYDMIVMMLKSAIEMLEPKLNAMIAGGRGVSSRMHPMGEREEMLMRNAVLTYAVMCETITHMRFTDDLVVNAACRELALQLLLPVARMRVLIKYLYYENILSYAVWSTDEADSAVFRAGTARALTRLLSEHLCLNEDTRWEMLEIFTRYEVVDKLALRPSFLQTLLMLVQRRMYECALQPHLALRRIFPEAERVILASWVRLEMPAKRRRLLVVTSRAYYILKEPLGQRCTVCDAHLFCPKGPDLVHRLNFRDVQAITVGHGCGQRVRILWSRHRVTLEKPAKPIQLSVLMLGMADQIAQALHDLNPLPKPPPIEPDLQTMRVVREKLLEPATEQIRTYLQVEKVELGSGRIVPRVVVISSSSLYLFIEDASYFLIEPQLTAAEKRSGRRDGMNLLKEDEKFRWTTLLEVDFLAGDQAVIAVRFAQGAMQLRFGDDFALSMFKNELRRLLPSGISRWRRDFGYHLEAAHEADDKTTTRLQAHGVQGAEEAQFSHDIDSDPGSRS